MPNTIQRIKKLSQLLANQIAAGEVAERPASVVKELIENSIDASAQHITIDIEKGGVGLIKIHDDGVGIHKDDLELAVNCHATSKIIEQDDLINVGTLGFRGEALASVSSVSRFCLTSNIVGQETAWQLLLDGRDDSSKLQPASHPRGTTVEVRDLFFNTPARRKFLRAERTEFNHIEEIVRRIALSRFEVGFTLKNNQKEILNLRPSKNENDRIKRIEKICSGAFINNSIAVDCKENNIQLNGWIAKPSFSRSQNDLQYFYVNGRLVRDKLINHAIRTAYQDLLYPGRQAAFVLYLNLEPSRVDVNVHPTKHEVRFYESRLIHEFLVNSISKKLNPVELEIGPAATKTYTQSETFQERPKRVQERVAVYDALRKASKSKKGNVFKNYVESEVVLHSKLENKETPQLGYAIGKLHDYYILSESKRGLVLVDLRKANNCISHARVQSDLATLSDFNIFLRELESINNNQDAWKELSLEELNKLFIL